MEGTCCEVAVSDRSDMAENTDGAESLPQNGGIEGGEMPIASA